MISIVSMVRRGSVLVSFLFGAMVFREKNLKSKAVGFGTGTYWYDIFVFGKSVSKKRRGVTHRAYPVILYYSIMILYSTSNVSFGSKFLYPFTVL